MQTIEREARRHQQRRLDVVEHRKRKRARELDAVDAEIARVGLFAIEERVLEAQLLQKPLRLRPVAFVARRDVVRRGLILERAGRQSAAAAVADHRLWALERRWWGRRVGCNGGGGGATELADRVRIERRRRTDGGGRVRGQWRGCRGACRTAWSDTDCRLAALGCRRGESCRRGRAIRIGRHGIRACRLHRLRRRRKLYALRGDGAASSDSIKPAANHR